MATTTTSFSVPRPRGDQLRALARYHRVSAAELLGWWIDKGLRDAGLDTTLPGMTIKAEGGAVRLDAGNGFAIKLPSNDAADLADALQSAAKGGDVALVTTSGPFITAMKHGPAVKVTVDEHGQKATCWFSPGIARAVARQIRAEIEHAQVN